MYANLTNIGFDNCYLQNLGYAGGGSLSATRHGALAVLRDCDAIITQSELEIGSWCSIGPECYPVSQLFVLGGSITIASCTLSDSASPVANAFHTLFAWEAQVFLNDIVFDGRSAPNHARAVKAYNSTTQIRNCEFFGGIRPSGDGGQPVDYMNGGAIFHSGGSLSIEDSWFHDCVASKGGAISSTGQFEVRRTEFTNNEAIGYWYSGQSAGGAIEAASADLEDCHFEGNTSDTWRAGAESSFQTARGGAVSLGGPSFVRSCSFNDNVVRTQSGAVYPGNQYGGAVAASGPIQFTDCLFQGNHSINLAGGNPNWMNPFDSLGGALHLEDSAQLTRCNFISNTADSGVFETPNSHRRGGAIYAEAGVLDLNDCRIDDSTAEQGGAIFLGSAASVQMEGTLLRNNRVANVTGTTDEPCGTAIEGSGTLVNCTIVGHDGSGSIAELVGQASLLSSCIVWGNGATGLPANTAVTYSTVEGGHPGAFNSDQDPLFWGTSGYRLLPASPAIDSGDPALTDPDGSRADMGAQPFDAAYCENLCAVPLGITPCLSNPNSTGVAAEIQAYGTNQVSDQFLMLSCTLVPIDSFGYFLASETADFVPLFGNSSGNLCLGGPILRMHDQVHTAGPGGRIGRLIDPGQVAYTHSILAGSEWNFQLWFRDPHGTVPTSNTSHSTVIQFQ